MSGRIQLTREELIDGLVEVATAPEDLTLKLTKNEKCNKFYHLFSSYPVRPIFSEKEPFFLKQKLYEPKGYKSEQYKKSDIETKEQEYFIKIPKHLSVHEQMKYLMKINEEKSQNMDKNLDDAAIVEVKPDIPAEEPQKEEI